MQTDKKKKKLKPQNRTKPPPFIMLMRAEFARMQPKLDLLILEQHRNTEMLASQIEEIYRLVQVKGIDTEELIEEIKDGMK